MEANAIGSDFHKVDADNGDLTQNLLIQPICSLQRKSAIRSSTRPLAMGLDRNLKFSQDSESNCLLSFPPTIGDSSETGNDNDTSELSFDSKSRKSPWWRLTGQGGRRRERAWLFGVLGSLILTVFVFGINICFLIWVRSRFAVVDDVAVLFKGSCSQASSLTSYADLAINVSSTLLLIASNNCSQLLASPTRAEVDNAHAKGDWVHIGTASFRNFRWIRRWRIILWCLLFLSSTPLHLLYNSVVFASSYTNDFLTAVVTEGFVAGESWNETNALEVFTAKSNDGSLNNDLKTSWGYRNTSIYTSVLRELQHGAQNLTKLSNDECQNAFGSNDLQSPYLNVLVITNHTSNDSFLTGEIHYPEWGSNGAPWFRTVMQPNSYFPPGTGEHKIDDYYYYSHGSNWSFPVRICSNSSCSFEPAWVQNCLAQPAEDFHSKCTVSIHTNLLLAVIACNAVKLLCFLAILLNSRFYPFATVGDAISSFMDEPDPNTIGCGPLSIFQAKRLSAKRKTYFKEIVRANHTKTLNLWIPQTKKWVSILSSTDKVLVFCICTYIPVTCAWFGGGVSDRFTSSFSQGITLLTYPNLGLWPSPSSLTGNSLLVNSPQLLASLISSFYNLLLIRMFVAYEYSEFGTRRRTLRVSLSKGDQRSTYGLQMPLKYALPIMGATSLLHWLISRGIYLTNVRIYSIVGEEILGRTRFAYALSAIATLLTIFVCIGLILLLLTQTLRNLGSGIPIIGSCSLAISAACHPVEGDEDAARKPLMYGAVKVDRLRGEQGWHACFSSKDVVPLREGVVYR